MTSNGSKILVFLKAILLRPIDSIGKLFLSKISSNPSKKYDSLFFLALLVLSSRSSNSSIADDESAMPVLFSMPVFLIP